MSRGVQFVCAVLLALCTHGVHAQVPLPLQHGNPQPDEHFATSVARCDGLSAVGCPQCGTNGKVFLYNNAGALIQTITYSGQSVDARFGEAMALTPNCHVLAVGAPGDDAITMDAGRVFMYTRTQDVYALRTSFTHTTAHSQDAWGSALAMSPDGELVAMSATGYGTYYAGKTAVRFGPYWLASRELVYSSTDPLDYSGYRIALSNDTLVATAVWDETDTAIGSFYVFKRHHGGADAWGETMHGDIPNTFQLGQDIALVGRWVFVGAPYDGEFPGQGSVYVLRLSANGNAFSIIQRIRAPNPQDEGGFGVSLSVSGDTLFVGEPGRERDGQWGVGSVHEFRRFGNSWTHVQEHISSGIFEGDVFGWSVAGFGGHVVSGTPYADVGGEDAGSADLYALPSIFADGFESGSHAAWRLVTE